MNYPSFLITQESTLSAMKAGSMSNDTVFSVKPANISRNHQRNGISKNQDCNHYFLPPTTAFQNPPDWWYLLGDDACARLREGTCQLTQISFTLSANSLGLRLIVDHNNDGVP